MARKKRKAAPRPQARHFGAEFQIPPAALRLAVPALVALFSAFAWTQRGVYVDGFFYLRIVDVFLHSGVLAYNPAERYETNTDFLWTFLLMPGPAVGLHPILWLHIVGVSVYAAALFAAFSFARKLLSNSEAALVALVLLGGHYSFGHIAVTGFGAILQALGALCCLLALLRFGESPNLRSGAALGFALLFLALCRLDSAVFGVSLVACALFFARREGKTALPAIALAMGIPSVLFGGVLLWKWLYYGDILPATYYIKGAWVIGGQDFSMPSIKKGAAYITWYWQKYFLWALAGFAFFGARALGKGRRQTAAGASRPVLWTMAVMCVMWHGYMLRTSGDVYDFRFLTPQAPLLMILAAAGLRGLTQKARWAATVGAVVLSVAYWQTGHIGTDVHKKGGGDITTDNLVPGLHGEYYQGLALRDLFGHLGKYPPEVRVAHISGASAVARARLGVNLLIGHQRALPEVDFSRPLSQANIPPAMQWAMATSYDFNIRDGTEFPPDTQLFAMPLPNGQFAPVVYFNRNETIDRILDERGIERVNVF